MEKNSKVTGTVMVMEEGKDQHSGRTDAKIVAVFGILSIPNGAVSDLHQYEVYGTTVGGIIQATILTDRGLNRKKESTGMGIAGLMTSGIWRV